MQISDRIDEFIKKQSWILSLNFYISLVLTFASILILRLRGAELNVSRGSFVSMGADIVALAICTVLLYSCKQDRNMDSPYTHKFAMLIFMTDLVTFTDFASWIVQYSAELRIWNIIVTTSNYVCGHILIFFFWLYVAEQLELEGRFITVVAKFMDIMIIPVLLADLVDLFYPLYFYVSDSGGYFRTDLYYFSHLYNMVAVVLFIIGLFRSRVSIKTKLISASFVLIPVTAQILSGYRVDISTQSAAMLVAVVLIYGVLFSDREKRLVSTENELSMANSIQTGFIPNIFPAFPGREDIDLYASMDTAKEVGGDFYDFFFIDKKHLAMVMADVSGKGIPAALFMMSAKIIINDRAMMGGTPAEILEYANARICEKNEEGMFVTVWLGILDLTTGKLTCANAGHEYPVFCRKGRFELYNDVHGFVVGGFDDEEYEDYEIDLEPGDYIFLYTDGITEANNTRGELFGNDRMLDALNACVGKDPEEILSSMKASVMEFADGEPQFDDITMMAVKYKGLPDKVVIPAERERLYDAIDYVNNIIGEHECSDKALMEIEIAVEEIFINIASYAYPEGEGDATVEAKVDEETNAISIRFIDRGIPYDPLQKEDPDTSLSVEDTPIGGLGIYMLKQSMDDIFYEYKDGQNILTIVKKLME